MTALFMVNGHLACISGYALLEQLIGRVVQETMQIPDGINGPSGDLCNSAMLQSSADSYSL